MEKTCLNTIALRSFARSECNRVNPLYTGRLFHCYMLDKSVSHFTGMGSILSLLFYF